MKKTLIILWTLFLSTATILVLAEFCAKKQYVAIGGTALKQYKIVVNSTTLKAADDTTLPQSGKGDEKELSTIRREEETISKNKI